MKMYLKNVHSLPEAKVGGIEFISEIGCNKVRRADCQRYHCRHPQGDKVVEVVLVREMKENPG